MDASPILEFTFQILMYDAFDVITCAAPPFIRPRNCPACADDIGGGFRDEHSPCFWRNTFGPHARCRGNGRSQSAGRRSRPRSRLSWSRERTRRGFLLHRHGSVCVLRPIAGDTVGAVHKQNELRLGESQQSRLCSGSLTRTPTETLLICRSYDLSA
jgi:hypothetical protein